MMPAYFRPMPARPKAARSGTLSPEAAADLAALVMFFEDRDRVFTQALGRRVRRNPVMDAIVRMMLVEFGREVKLHVADYQARLAFLASRTAIRGELAELEDLGALILTQDGRDRRARLVEPTEQIVTLYNRLMPSLRDQAADLLCRQHPDTIGMELWGAAYL